MHWRALTLLGWFAAGLVAAGRAEDGALRASKPEVRQEVVAVINGQLTAFRGHDAKQAYAYAAAALRAQKPLPVFLEIVKANYPEIWASRRAEFGIVRDDGATATVLVHVIGANSDASYDYTLVKEGAAWRIHDVLRHTRTASPDNV